MKYKVGDKVKIKENLITGETYGGVYLYGDACRHIGEETMITKVIRDRYRLGVDNSSRIWTGEMLEPVDEMSAEEMIKEISTMCEAHSGCVGCQIRHLDDDKGCVEILGNHYEDVVEILKQWKADHEKKPIETENAWFILIMDTNRKIVHEEKLDAPCDRTFNLDYEQRVALKRYCNEHDGKFIAVREFRSVVKE